MNQVREYFPNVDFRDYQCSAVDFAVQRRRILLADAMGLGKTRSAIAAGIIMHPEKCRRLTVCAASALYPWQRELEKYFPEQAEKLLVIEGYPYQREKQWEEFKRREGSIHLLMSYGILHQDMANMPLTWDHFDADEIHKAMNHETKTFKDVKKIRSDSMILISGTPADRGPEEMYSYFNLIDPENYPSYWKFVRRYCRMEKGPFGYENWGPQNMPDFRMRRDRIMIRRTKKQVAKELPPKLRLPLYATMYPDQEKPYQDFHKHMIAVVGDRILLNSTSISNTMRLRQVLACPKYMDASLSMGAGIDAIVNHILDNNISHPVIMCPFPSLFPLMQEYLQEKLKRPGIVLRGGMDSKQVRKAITGFEQEEKAFVLLSIKFAQSFDLTKSCTGYMLGYEYRVLENEQAEDRLHRLSSVEPVTIYYVILRHANGMPTEDESVLDILDEKKRNTNPFLGDEYDIALGLYLRR